MFLMNTFNIVHSKAHNSYDTHTHTHTHRH